jgi:ABC-type glutathione transport system ATPase component
MVWRSWVWFRLPEKSRLARSGLKAATWQHSTRRRSARSRQPDRDDFQDPMTSLNPFLRICDQIMEATRLHLRHSRVEAMEHAVKMLDMVGIPDARARAGSYPHQFSGGMRQRVMIAMALACQPQLLIADEPTTALMSRPGTDPRPDARPP